MTNPLHQHPAGHRAQLIGWASQRDRQAIDDDSIAQSPAPIRREDTSHDDVM